jgi:hypothetical protein
MGTKKPKPGTPVSIQVPEDLEPKYANFVLITHSPAEIILDFAQILPHSPKRKVESRIVMTPMHAKLLYNALGKNLSQFEAKYGQIKTPQGPSLADQLFGQIPPTDKEE